MSDGSDNPMLDMGLLGMLQPNPYLDPSRAGKPLPLPGYRGVATNAMGQPIQSDVDAIKMAAQQQPSAPAQGTTLNSMPQQIADLQAQVNQGTINSANANLNSNIAAGTAPGYSGRGAETGIANYPGAADAIIGLSNYKQQANQAYAANPDFGLGMPQQQPQQSAAPTSSSVDLRQAYLDALANPGKVTTPGATVPQSQPLGVPSVMTSFLAAHPSGGGKGAGAYDNSPFFNTLNQLGTA